MGLVQSQLALSQPDQDHENNSLKNFTVYTPNSYSFSKVSNSKIGYFRGQIQPSIPVFHKKMSVLALGVSLDYLGGGGIKVNDPGSNVGRGWRLNCGGMIVRELKGVPDDYQNRILAYSDFYNKDTALQGFNGILYSGGIAHRHNGLDTVTYSFHPDTCYYYHEGSWDSERDIFEFSLPGKSGRFYIGNNKEVVIQDSSKIQIIPQYSTDTGYVHNYDILPNDFFECRLIGFKIIDENGVKYNFDLVERGVTGWPYLNRPEGSFFNYAYASGWLLTKIEAPSGEESIKFNYVNNGAFAGPIFLVPYQKYTRRTLSKDPDHFYTSDGTSFFQQSAICSPWSIQSVVFSDSTKVTFDYFDQAPYITGRSIIKDIKVVNSENRQVKKFLFNYLAYPASRGDYIPGYLNYNDSTIGDSDNYPKPMSGLYAHLESIYLQSTESKIQPYYSFSYYLDSLANEIKGADQNGIDYWGYFNGKNNGDNALTVPRTWGTPAADRAPDINFTRVAALKSIIYPTGGSEVFEYESNDKFDSLVNANVTVGGMRIRKVTLHDPTGTSRDIVKEYKYVDSNGRSSGFLGDGYPQFTYLINYYEGWPTNQLIDATDTTTVSEAVNPLSTLSGDEAGYRRVVETTVSGDKNIGSTVYEFSDLSYVKFWETSELFPYSPVEEPLWAIGLPTVVSQYDSAGNILEMTENRYKISQSYFVDDDFRSLYMAYKGWSSPSMICKFKNYYPLLGRSEMISSSKTSYAYSPAGQLTEVTTMVYDPNYHVLREKQTIDSKGDSIETKYHYPFDYSLGAQSAITIMAQKNMLNVPISVETWKNNHYLLSCEVTDYADIGNGIIRPSKSYLSTSGGPVQMMPTFNGSNLLNPNYSMEKEGDFSTYDDVGRLLTFTGRGDNVHSVILDSSDNILAKATNANYAQIAYTGFENEEASGWNYSSAGITSVDKKVGMNCYVGTVTKSGLPVGDYRVRLWAKGSGNIIINGSNGNITINGINIAISNQWSFFTITVRNTASVTISSNGNWIDEVAVNPVTAMMTNYTYNKEVGVSSESDDNGMLKQYEYDGFNRLIRIRDKDDNILRSYTYQPRVYFNKEYPATYSFYSCHSVTYEDSVPGAPVTYIVPANLFLSLASQADADMKAAWNASHYGQRYANTHSNCVPIYYNAATSGVRSKSPCTVGYYDPGIYYYVPAKKFSSLISQASADSLAQADINANAQNYANDHGICQPYVSINANNENGYEGYFIVFINSIDGSSWQFPIPTDGGFVGQIPVGTYEVRITSTTGSTDTHSFTAGCYPNSSSGISADFSNVNISSSCSNIIID